MRCPDRGRRPVGPWCSIQLGWIGVLLPLVAAVAGGGPPAFVLDLPGGGILPGNFTEAESGPNGLRESLGWRSPAFAAPFEFRLDAISGIRVKTVLPARDAAGFRCRLRGGDVIDGSLEAIDADHVVLQPLAGGPPVRIDRRVVVSLGPRAALDGGGYVGPGGLAGWRQEPAGSWRDEAGRLVCERRSARVMRDVGAPARARYDLVLSWQQPPDLVVSVGATEGKPDAVAPYRFELINVGVGLRTGMIVRQERTRGGIEEVALPATAKGGLRLSLFLDQATGRLAAAVEGSEGIVEITVTPEAGRAPSGLVQLTLLSGDVRLDSLRVSEWQEADPQLDGRSRTAVTTRDGRTIEGEVVSFVAAGSTLVVAGADGPRELPLATIRSIDFAAAEEPAGADPEPPPAVRAVQLGGGIVTGELVAVRDGLMLIRRAGVEAAVPVPLSELVALVSLRSADPPPLPTRVGTLLLEGIRLPGCLVDGVEWGGGLAWLPTGSLAASGFASGGDLLAAEVEYVPGSRAGRGDPRPDADEELEEQVEIGGIGGAINRDPDGFFVVTMLSDEGAAARDGRIQPGDRIVAIRPVKEAPFVEAKGLELNVVMNLLRGRVGTPVAVRIAPAAGGEAATIELVRGLIYVGNRSLLDEALAAHAQVVAQQPAVPVEAGFPAAVVLRSGDSVPARIERIDASGVRLRTPLTVSAGKEPVTVAQHLVKAVELDPLAASRGLDVSVFDRLLTLPRSQQSKPPTHVVRLRTGDYLRGRLESLDERQVRMEVHGQMKNLPRESVVRVIWLHPEELVDRDLAQVVAEEEPGPGGPAGVVVQAVSPAGERTTLVAERVDGTAIIGSSEAFGESRLETTRADRLLLGAAIGGDAALPFAKWRLKLAPLPRALRNEE